MAQIRRTSWLLCNQTGLQGAIKRARFTLRAAMNLTVWRRWFQFLEGSPFAALAAAYPRLYEKPLRPYVHKDITAPAAVGMLEQHYSFLLQRAPATLLQALCGNEPFLLNERTRDAETPLVINLTYAKHMQQEGELTLSLGPPESMQSSWQHAWIASLTFTICRDAEGWAFRVGGVQGGMQATGKQDAKLATRVFYGLRPKSLLIHVLRELAASWGIGRIQGISDAKHCFMRKRYRGRIRIKSSYDELWREAGGQLTADGYFDIPVLLPRRSLASIPSRKRAQYQRRYELLAGIDAEIRSKLAMPLAVAPGHPQFEESRPVSKDIL